MQLTSVTHICGHTSSEVLEGIAGEREAQRKSLEAKPCPSCGARLAIDRDQKEGLSRLQGTDRPVIAASETRHDIFQRLTRKAWSIIAKTGLEAKEPSRRAREVYAALDVQIIAITQGLANETDAAWLAKRQTSKLGDIAKVYAHALNQSSRYDERQIS